MKISIRRILQIQQLHSVKNKFEKGSIAFFFTYGFVKDFIEKQSHGTLADVERNISQCRIRLGFGDSLQTPALFVINYKINQCQRLKYIRFYFRIFLAYTIHNVTLQAKQLRINFCHDTRLRIIGCV